VPTLKVLPREKIRQDKRDRCPKAELPSKSSKPARSPRHSTRLGGHVVTAWRGGWPSEDSQKASKHNLLRPAVAIKGGIDTSKWFEFCVLTESRRVNRSAASPGIPQSPPQVGPLGTVREHDPSSYRPGHL